VEFRIVEEVFRIWEGEALFEKGFEAIFFEELAVDPLLYHRENVLPRGVCSLDVELVILDLELLLVDVVYGFYSLFGLFFFA
jgi:hypothetical protein